jgi:predicted acylesterase/phospholipase RssA
LLAVSVIASLAACAYKLDARSLFAGVSYADKSDPSPQLLVDDLNLQVFASLELEAVMAYRNPTKMAACFRALAKWDESKHKTRLQRLGEVLAAKPNWAPIAAKMKLPDECTDTGDSPALVRYVVARIANSIVYMADSGAMSDERRQEYVYLRVPKALNAIADIVERTSPNTTSEAQDSVALALRGGAANGAFSAGFLFELLSLRERALPPEGDSGNYRFSAMVGTSVGALIAQLLDLYFVDPSIKNFTPAQQAYIDACKDYWIPEHRQYKCYDDIDKVRSDGSKENGNTCYSGWPRYQSAANLASDAAEDDKELSGLDIQTREALFARHPLQMCSLTRLYQYFTDDDEQTLMCVEPGPITRVLGGLGTPDQNLMRFDPMASNVIAPVLDAFSDVLIKNDVPRVVVAVELQDNQVLGLDERTCALMPSRPTQGNVNEAEGGREYCLGAGVMASAVIPAYARPVRHLYDGVSKNGFCGSWFDGGLRSVFPAYRALRMTRPTINDIVGDYKKRELRVLAVGTGTLQGLPVPRPSNILQVTLDGEGQATGQNDLDEIMMARQMAQIREQQLCDIMKNMDTGSGAVTCEKNPDSISDDASVTAIYVPAETPAYLVEGAEYSFDRTLMRGLWVWGRHVAIERVLNSSSPHRGAKLFSRLGWEKLESKAVELAQQDARTMQPWLNGFNIGTECSAHRNARVKAGQHRIRECVPDCAKVTETNTSIPQYYVCPKAARIR